MMSLPSSWSIARFEHVFDKLQYGLTAKADHAAKSTRFLRITDIDDGAVDWSTVPGLVSDEDYARYLLSDGDFVFARSGSIEKAARIDKPPKAVFASYLIRGRPALPALSDWLSHFIRGDAYLAQVHERAAGIGMANVNAAKLNTISVPIAPLPEQRRIVAKIVSLSGKSHRARVHLGHITRLVEKYKQAVLAAAFRGDLTRDFRARHVVSFNRAEVLEQVRKDRDTMRIENGLRAKGKNRSVPPRIEELTSLPNGWIWLTFDDCSWDMTVGHVGPMKDRYVPQGIPFLRSLNVRPTYIDTRKIVYIDQSFDRELTKSRLAAGDLVVVRTGEPGVAAVVPEELGAANCSDLVICRLIDVMDPHFAAHYMNSEYAKTLVRGFQVGVAQQHFNVGAMSGMPIPFPSTAEQQVIVQRIENAFSWIDRLATEAASADRLIDQLDQAVLAKAFRGELVPQDPNDEPASVLLERIKKERQSGNAAPSRRRRKSG